MKTMPEWMWAKPALIGLALLSVIGVVSSFAQQPVTVCVPTFINGQLNCARPGSQPTTNVTIVIAAGNTFQTILAASTSRLNMTIQNNNTNGDNCWLFIGAGSATKATSILLGQGGSYQRYFPYIPSDAIQATCTTTSDTLYVDTQ